MRTDNDRSLRKAFAVLVVCFLLLFTYREFYLEDFLYSAVTRQWIGQLLLVNATGRTRPSRVYKIRAVGNVSSRIYRLNIVLGKLRRRIWQQRDTEGWRNFTRMRRRKLICSVSDDFMFQLSRFDQADIIGLPWPTDFHLRGSTSSSSFHHPVPINSSSLIIDKYYRWTASEDRLCSWIDNGHVNHGGNCDVTLGRTCYSRNIRVAARALPLQLYPSPEAVQRSCTGRLLSHPDHFSMNVETFALYLTAFHDVIVTGKGDVIGLRMKLIPDGCVADDVSAEFPPSYLEAPVYDEVLVVAQTSGGEAFHRQMTLLSRISLYSSFLKWNSHIRILSADKDSQLVQELLSVLGLDKSRLLSGVVRVKLAYVPQATWWTGRVGIVEIQTASLLYRNFIKAHLPSERPHRLVLVRRTGVGRFSEPKVIEDAMSRVAKEFRLTYTLFVVDDDGPQRSLNKTMLMFNSAVMIVGTTGLNILFSEPGVFLVEPGICEPRQGDVFYPEIARLLGHRWHGIASRQGGCKSKDVVDVTTTSVERAVRELLHLRSATD